MLQNIKKFFTKEEKVPQINLDNAWLSFLNSVSTEINKSLYYNYAINSGLQNISRGCKSLEFGVYIKKNRTFEKSESENAKYLEKTIKQPNNLHNWNLLIDSFVFGIFLNGSLLFRRVEGIKKDDIFIYNNQYFQVNRNNENLEIESIVFSNKMVSGDMLKNYVIANEFNPSSILQGTENGVPRAAALEPIKKLMNGIISYNVNYMEHGGLLAGILNIAMERVPTESEKEKYDRQFKDSFTGTKNAGKIKITYGKDSSFTPINATNPRDLDYVEGLKELEKKVALGLGIPLPLVSSDSSTYNNLETAKKTLYEDTVIPLMKEFCGYLNKIFEDSLSEGEEFYFDESAIKSLQIDLSNNVKNTVSALTGLATVNGVIRVINSMYNLNLEELGDQGEVVLVPGSFVDLKDMSIFIPQPTEGQV